MSDDRLILPDPPAALEERLADGAAIAWREGVSMRTYEPGEPDTYPMFLDRRVYQGSSGRVYPIPFIDSVSTEGTARSWDAIHLENRWVRLMILPELGGRIHVGYDKVAGYDFFYRNNVIKPALVGLAGPWISGGVEFNWPQHHRPATFLPVETAIETDDDGTVTVWCSDHDPFTRMKGMHGVRLRPDSSVIELVGRVHNRTDEPQTFHWWANVAARVHDDYQAFFPTDVTYVADHARRAITAFPEADRHYYGVDYPSRAATGGDRLDFFRNIHVPTSYMVTDTDDDFFGGYDHRVGAGFVHVADRHVAPGKKLWTWGDAEFGRAWDRQLTDDDGPYIELMAGVYTDNQPDFAWLEPGETKSFTQYWYPIQGTGTVQQATTDAVVHLAVEGGVAELAVGVTAVRPQTRVTVTVQGGLVFEELVDLAPGTPFTASVTTGEAAPDEVEVHVEQAGTVLVSWRPRPETPGELPWTAAEPLRPGEIESADELYFTGVHLEQFRHPSRSPLPYWREALRRDPGDSRCNLALARDAYRRGDYAVAETHARRALERITVRNANPRDGETSYLLGLVLARTGRTAEAYDALAKAAWDARWSAAAAVQLGRIDARAGRWRQALERADAALAARPDDSRARSLQVVALRALDRRDDAERALASWLADDPLDQVALTLSGRPGTTDPRTTLDVALELRAAGDRAGALVVLERAAEAPATAAGNPRPLAHYHRAALLAEQGLEAAARVAREAARAADATRCFPSGLDDHDVLRAALDADPRDTRAAALLALLLVDRAREAEALELWTDAIAAGLEDAVAFRTAAIAAVNLTGDVEQALDWYDRALALDPGARLLYERDQLLARMGASAEERLTPLDGRRDDVLRRDDLTVSYCRLLARTGRALEALEIMRTRQFAPWEGGEGQTIAAWEELALALSDAARDGGDLEEAASFARRAIELPTTLGEVRHPLTDTRELHERLAVLLDELGRADDAAGVRASAVVSEVAPVAASLDDDEVDFFATSLPDLLLFARAPKGDDGEGIG
ncbi:tetratricopeptide (TPR) repeat protein [Agromyces hippuratus]|uniref:Tetratricopeptide (TPR) repeat protein n=1 Tax=Agromyces hippuratus TaxID=286438 RepID=A0A852X1L4_9MICO|nr:DUF5107 domain-containing protein [Agromyces hippuratus]NYG22440.1 tetratricopeptide (TPR) repeat protein [Agromyces hippuratus]